MLQNNRYRIIRTLGSGGFGETFLAEDSQIPSLRRCVIKQLKPIQNNPQIYELVQQRFRREAAILEELGDGSSQIPRLYAYFSENSLFYLVQEYIEGQTLTEKIQQQGLMSEHSVKELLNNILPVLDYVHSKGIVHRDIKPDNILIRNVDGKPILIDFGAVKETLGTMLTPSGNSANSIVIGTPGFMSSEQSVGRPMFASDIYSLGLTAIYLLTGKLPQELETNPATGNILWRQFATNVSPSFAAVLDKAIQFNAGDRFAKVRDMLQTLQSPAPSASPTILNTQLPTIPSPPTPQQTIAVSPRSPQPSHQNNQGSGHSGILIGSLIAGGLIGASIIIGLTLSKSPQPVGQQLAQQRTASSEPIAPSEPEDTAPPVQPKKRSKIVPTLDSSREAPVEPQVTESPVSKQIPNPTSISSSLPKQPPVNKPLPEQVVRDYFTTLNQGKYQDAWNQLSPSLQKNKTLHPDGYLSYIDWWGRQVRQIEIDQVSLVEAGTERATVKAQLKYLLKNGNVVPSNLRVSLLWDVENSRWVLADAQ
ncbi:MAG: protein kinase [Rhizonema sp. PD38]|nr:protein kinase [Rhizonema sp. PD38]